MNEFAAVMQWIALGQQAIAKGAEVMAQIKGVLAANGIEADTAALDAVIADADRRKKLAEDDARPPAA